MNSSYIWVSAFGALWSAIEILSRYKDEPFKVLGSSVYCGFFILFNATISGACFYCLNEVFAADLQKFFSAKAGVVAFCVSSFGAPLFFRSRLFDIRSGERTIQVGPGFVMDEFLTIVDRQIDRKRAEYRLKFVYETMKHLDFANAKSAFMLLAPKALQRLQDHEKSEYLERVEAISRDNEPQLRSYALGFVVLDLMGERFLTTLVNTVRETNLNLPEEAEG